mgnify:FL=1
MRVIYALMLILMYSIAQAGVVDESQKLLNQLGYNAGSVDGVYGGKTERALIQFYKDRSEKFDGKLSSNELTDLYSAAAADTANTRTIFITWSDWILGDDAPAFHGTDRLLFNLDEGSADGDITPTITFNHDSDESWAQGREKLKIALVGDDILSIKGRLTVTDLKVNLDVREPLSSGQIVLPLGDADKFIISWTEPSAFASQWHTECDQILDKRIPKISQIDCGLERASGGITLDGKRLSDTLPSIDAAMTVTGFPGVEDEHVFRFQTIIGVCSKNDWDCRKENLRMKTTRSEVSIPNKLRAKEGDTSIVEYDLFIPKNPNIKHLAETRDWFNFGQLHGWGDEDVPVTVAVVREDERVKLVENGNRTDRSPVPGSLAVYLRAVVFKDVFEIPGGNSAIVLADPGEFQDRWMTFRFEVKWAKDETGSLNIIFDGDSVFECSRCVTLPVHKKAANRNGKKGKQKISFQFGIYSWRIIDEGIDRFQDTPPPMVVAYYKNVGWKARN